MFLAAYFGNPRNYVDFNPENSYSHDIPDSHEANRVYHS